MTTIYNNQRVQVTRYKQPQNMECPYKRLVDVYQTKTKSKILADLYNSSEITGPLNAKKVLPYSLREGSQHFEDFIDTHNKVYNSDEEKALRYEIFLKNLEEINQLNSKYEHTEFGVNQFSDLTRQEFQALNKCLKAPAEYLGSSCTTADSGMKNKHNNNVSIPQEFDWRDKNVVTRVKDQRQCGSCWAFSAVGNVESVNAIHSGNLIELSEQQVVDCDTSDGGCGGGYPAQALEYLISNGAMTSESYPYEGTQDTCRYQDGNVAVHVTGCVTVSSDEDAIAEQLVARAPLSITIAAAPVQHYSGGVLTGDSCQDSQVNHAVILVGYGVDSDSGLSYWLVKNSWGESWGEQGYFRMQRGVNCLNILNSGSPPVTAEIN